jgi:hypothetical protein
MFDRRSEHPDYAREVFRALFALSVQYQTDKAIGQRAIDLWQYAPRELTDKLIQAGIWAAKHAPHTNHMENAVVVTRFPTDSSIDMINFAFYFLDILYFGDNLAQNVAHYVKPKQSKN